MTRSSRVSPLTLLGVHPGTKRGVGVDLPARLRGTYVLGVTGAGKTTLLLGMISQDLALGRAVLVLDPNGDLITDICDRAHGLGRQQDICLLDMQSRTTAFGVNLFACADPSDPQAVADTAERVVAIFKKVWGDVSWIGRMGDLLANAAHTLVATPGSTLADLPPLLTDAAFRRRLVERLANPVVREFWTREYDKVSEGQRQQIFGPLLNKARAFLRDPFLLAIVGQKANTVDLGWAIRRRKVVLVRLHPKLEEATNLIGTAIIQQLAGAAFDRADLPERERIANPLMLYADEAQRFATPSFITLLREARKYGVATTAATQMHELLPEDVATAFTNAATIVCFQIVLDDAKALHGLFDGSSLPRPRVLAPDPLAIILRGHPDSRLVAMASAIERHLSRYHVIREQAARQAREHHAEVANAASVVRQVRTLLDGYLFARMAGQDSDGAWEELRQVAYRGIPVAQDAAVAELLGSVVAVGKELARRPVCVEREASAPRMVDLLTRLPFHHALVRYREGTELREAFVRVLQTRPLTRPLPVAPVGIPRAPLPPPSPPPEETVDGDEDPPPPSSVGH